MGTRRNTYNPSFATLLDTQLQPSEKRRSTTSLQNPHQLDDNIHHYQHLEEVMQPTKTSNKQPKNHHHYDRKSTQWHFPTENPSPRHKRRHLRRPTHNEGYDETQPLEGMKHESNQMKHDVYDDRRQQRHQRSDKMGTQYCSYLTFCTPDSLAT